LLEQFDVDIADEANLVLLPIGFKKPISPLDFLSNKSGIQSSSTAVQSFVKSIIESTETIENAGLDDSIFFSFKMALMNESRIKNADVVAAITKDKSNASINVENVIDKFILVTDESTEGVKHVKIDEESLFKTIYTLAYPEVFKKCKEYFIDFKQNKEFHDLLNKLKKNPNLYKKRYANVLKPTNYQGFYSEKIFEELGRHYKLK
jgi:hypothetical protein